ncbi:MAG TPA: prolyl oligopeptidase family serine peptidase [Vicinamibacteria bacterium]|nr:prolyl oligopeptidase family serine peptidase [Vicinamibacteria bacterium]
MGLVVSVLALAGAGGLRYPAARKADVVDDYHGTKVADPYRWLERADDPETARWVEAENDLTRSLLEGPPREAIKKRLQELYDYPRVGLPEALNGRYFYTRNSGLQNQSVLFVREGIAGPERVLLDPNTLSPDGTVALTMTSVTRDGSLMAYTLSRSGSDRQEIFVREVLTGRDRPDHLLWAKFTSLAWTPNNDGFYYTRYPVPGTVPSGDENYYARVYYHRMGDSQEKDALAFERTEAKDIGLGADVTRDGRFLILTSYKGSSGNSEIHILDRRMPGARPFLLLSGFEHRRVYTAELEGRLYFQTNEGAPLGRVVSVDLGKGEREAREVLPEGADSLSEVALVSRRLVVVRLHNASHRVLLHALDGKLERAIELPDLGSVSGLSGEPEDRELFLGFSSYAQPATPYRFDFTRERLTEFEPVHGKADGGAYETTQVFFPSKDGTRVSMFLVHRKGLAKDGHRPTLLYGYGGFNISQTPVYSPSRFVWLERGAVLAVANLRGGGEYGEAWHQAGMQERKQNVFDDFIAAAEWLIANGYTRPTNLAIQGGSNGGLLVGAAMVQRPELFGAVVCQVPVADMLRYHLFTVGRFWIPEYGSSEDPRQFAFLYRYSPYHNVKDGVAYPATLVTTADTDDRVAPGLAKKFAARLQSAAGGQRPILIRIETKAGHGAGKPVSKQIEEQADVYRFLFWQVGES